MTVLGEMVLQDGIEQGILDSRIRKYGFAFEGKTVLIGQEGTD